MLRYLTFNILSLSSIEGGLHFKHLDFVSVPLAKVLILERSDLWLLRYSSFNILRSSSIANMRNYEDGANAACVKKLRNIRMCIKFMLKFTRKTHTVTILRDNWYLIHSYLVKIVQNRRNLFIFSTHKNCQKCT